MFKIFISTVIVCVISVIVLVVSIEYDKANQIVLTKKEFSKSKEFATEVHRIAEGYCMYHEGWHQAGTNDELLIDIVCNDHTGVRLYYDMK